jgi:hypothetical protein
MSQHKQNNTETHDHAAENDKAIGLSSPQRRKLLRHLAGATSATMAASVMGFGTAAVPTEAKAHFDLFPGGGPDKGQRRLQALQVRIRAAQQQASQPVGPHPDNRDELIYPGKIGNYSKGLPHNRYGEVDLNAYSSLKHALKTGRPADFESIILGTPDPSLRRRLVNPQAGLAFDMEGGDSHSFSMRPAPAFASAEAAGEIVENYWMALLRDVPLSEFNNDTRHPLVLAAVDDLNRLSDFRGPKVNGKVTPQTLFRDDLPGALTGPYISQFMWLPCPYGANYVEQKLRTTIAGLDYMTTESSWLEVQNGHTQAPDQFDPTRRYIINGRDLGQWVHLDVLFQAYFQACLILGTGPNAEDPHSGGIGAPSTPTDPYLNSATQLGFATFGDPFKKTVVSEVATRALKAAWFQKWFVHLRLRPEAFGGRVHFHMTKQRRYPLHADVLNSQATREVFARHGTYLLPMAFPEGSPLHPAYAAGHATVAGACVTILKALFDENFVIPNPVVPTEDGFGHLPYTGEPLTVGGELNKLAVNVAFGRNIAGVHWRSDGSESLQMGEQVAIKLLQDMRLTFNEKFAGFRFTKFDGTQVTI